MVTETIEARLEPSKEVDGADSLLNEIYQAAKNSDTPWHPLSIAQIIEGTFDNYLARETGLSTEHKDAYLQVKDYFGGVGERLFYAAQLAKMAEPVDTPLAVPIIIGGVTYGLFGLMFGSLIAVSAFLVTHFVAHSYETIGAGAGLVAGFGLYAAAVHDSTKGGNAINKANILCSQEIVSKIRTEAKEIFLAAYGQNARMPES